MKLLPKKLITASLASERKEAIDRGVALAQKVDSVRETLSKEETRLAEFRTLSIAQVQAEIDALLREKNGLERAILIAEEELRERRKPLDAEWAHCKEQKALLEGEKQKILEKLHSLNEGLNLNIRRERLNAEEEQRLVTLRHQQEADVELALDAKRVARRELANARKEAEQLTRTSKKREDCVLVREQQTAGREEELTQKEKQLVKRDKEQNDRDRQLLDRYNTLLRTEKRLNK